MHILYIKDENGNFVPIKTLKGADGKSAYESAVEGGFIGTYEEFCQAIAELTPNAELTRYAKHFNNKDNPHGVTAEQIGAIPAVYYRSDDLNTELAAGGNKMTVCYYDSTTKNTPYSEDLTDYEHGMVITNAHTDAHGRQYGTQLCLPSGDNSMYLRRCNKDGKTSWLKISPSDIMTKTGGEVTGAIKSNKGEWEQYQIISSNGAYRCFEGNNQVARIDVRNEKDDKNRRYLDIFSPVAQARISYAARIVQANDGVEEEAYLLHTQNKPTSTYVGNGETRTIDTGGIGNLLLLWNDNAKGWFIFVTPHGARGIVTTSSDDGYGLTGIKFKNGVITMDDNNSYNQSGVTYHYQVL